jgi:Fe2+ or Zn2+ uptake regulation protein
MKLSSEALADKLHNKGIRPSYHRIRVLEYLYRKKENHPTADEVFEALSPDIPSLSKTTVYNALHTFVESGLARVVDIDDSEARYDTMLLDHGHFKCTACGAISNFAVDFACISIGGLDQFEIYEKNVYFKGLCPKCRNPKT